MFTKLLMFFPFVLALSLFELAPLARQKRWGEFATAMVIIILGVGASAPNLLGLRLPGPFTGIEALVRLVERLFQ